MGFRGQPWPDRTLPTLDQSSAVITTGVNATAVWVVPASQEWDPYALAAGFTTGGTGGNRELELFVDDGLGDTIAVIPAGHAQPISLTQTYSWVRGVGAVILPSVGNSIAGPMITFPLLPTWRIGVRISKGGVAGDAFVTVGQVPTLTFAMLAMPPLRPF